MPVADRGWVGAAVTDAQRARLSRSSPAPWAARLALVIGRDVVVSAYLSRSGVHVGCLASNRATLPAVTAVASDVPLPRM